MADEDSFLRGDTVIYQEDAAIYEMKVLDNSSDRNNIIYKLRLDKIIQRHGVLEDYGLGETVTCTKKRNGHIGGSGWSVSSREEFNARRPPENRIWLKPL